MIGPLRAEHARAVADLHCATLTGLLSRLGPAAAEAFYTGCVRTDLAIGLVDADGPTVRGFVLGSMHPDRLNDEVVRENSIATIASVGKGIVRRPSTLRWLVGSMRGPEEGTFDTTTPSLVYLAVNPDRRRSGTGRQLVAAFGERLRAAGADSYDLSVDDANSAAIAFYEQLGCRQIGSYREFGSMHRRYRLAL